MQQKQEQCVMRLAEPGDTSFIVTQLKEAAKEGHYIDYDTQLGREAIAHVVKRGITARKAPFTATMEVDCEYWVWEMESGRLAAYAAVNHLPDRPRTGPDCIELHQLTVSGHRRRQGHGRAFLKALLACEQYRNRDVLARCFPASQVAIELLKQEGFREDGERISAGITCLFLRRSTVINRN